MTTENTLYKKEVERLNEEIRLLAGKPFEELTDKEKQDVVTKWTILRTAPPSQRKTMPNRIMTVIIYATGFVFFSCFLLIAVKWFMTILGIL